MSQGTVVVLTGGVGGAKLVSGRADIVAPEKLTAIVNTGDDFTHLGLRICPDIDTLIYTLAGIANPELGWGRSDESWNFMEALAALGGEDWFSLGDRDLAMHIERTRRLAEGETLSSVTRHLAEAHGIETTILPMSDQPVSTMIASSEGMLAFQDYFVRQKCEPSVEAITFNGAIDAAAPAEALSSLKDPNLEGIVIAPSNPWLSIDPILAVPGIVTAIKESPAPVVAVTPLPGGKAIKGPTAKIMDELDMPLSVQSIADHYREIIDGLLIDATDQEPVSVNFARQNTIMIDHADKISLARAALDFAKRIASDGEKRR